MGESKKKEKGNFQSNRKQKKEERKRGSQICGFFSLYIL